MEQRADTPRALPLLANKRLPPAGGRFASRTEWGNKVMSSLPTALLGAALRVKWEHGRAGDEQAVRLLSERIPGFSAGQYAEAGRLASVLDGAAYELAAAWFASGGQAPMPRSDELECLCPGFAEADYIEAIHKNILWARK
jgi:hypothetical protein